MIESDEPRQTPEGARTIPFGFARALVEPAKSDGWDEHAEALVG